MKTRRPVLKRHHPSQVQHDPVPRLFPGSTVACIGTGPSLLQEDVDLLRGKVRVVAVNDAYRMAPWADVLHACDGKWWMWHRGVPQFQGPKFTLDKLAARWPGVKVLRNTGTQGIETDPRSLRTGRNSGYQAVNIAVHLGAKRIILLGYDMGVDKLGKTHWFGHHPDKAVSPYKLMIAEMERLPGLLAPLGVEIVNCSRRSAVKGIPASSLEGELCRIREAVAC